MRNENKKLTKASHYDLCGSGVLWVVGSGLIVVEIVLGYRSCIVIDCKVQLSVSDRSNSANCVLRCCLFTVYARRSPSSECPCPQLVNALSYRTPPTGCLRRVCCCCCYCEFPSSSSSSPGASSPTASMPFLGLSVFRDAKSTCMFLGLVLVTYYLIMDIILFMRFRTVDIVEDSKPGPPDEVYSPFTHLSIKALMNDHTSQYVISPSAEYFDMATRFSTVFSFITPNVISFTHLFLGLVSGKFVASEHLHDRRVGVLIFQVRTWLDAFDGVVYRSQSNTHLQFQSVRNTTGYYVDTTCDALGGVFLCFGILFYLWKRFDPYKQGGGSAGESLLPVWGSNGGGVGVGGSVGSGGGKDGLKSKNGGSDTHIITTKSGVPTNGHCGNGRGETYYSKKYIFWKVFCFGLALAAAGKLWDYTVGDFKEVLQVPMKDAKTSMLQFELCHSSTTIFILYMWRLFEGQALLQYVLIPILIDKIWVRKQL
ncbi:ceramide phosphoethanolamine synthase-like isoform x1 [Plakobranchus ocellatus]|uniref:Ceramide phosphoethanolamine synthase-like isoform x1 n=1 Tax=Plakobranchus ocellatus TaxID=259542 RepID=A0AAV4DRF5_9GAST|nr:ceramide phosphoethanolamine synthase-like isoform x1 [Plakobranchus ocellatus]